MSYINECEGAFPIGEVAARAAWYWCTQEHQNQIFWGELQALSKVDKKAAAFLSLVLDFRDELLQKQQYGEELFQEDFEVLRQLCARMGWVPPHYKIDLESLPK